MPLERSGPTYNGKPLMNAGLADQKRHMSVHLTALYADPAALARFRERYAATGKRVDMGASCVRFRSLDDLPLDLVGEAVAAGSVETLVAAAAR